MPSNGSSNSLVWVLYWTALPGNSAGGAWMQHRHHRGGECWGVEAKESQIQQRWYFCIFHTQHIHSSTHIHTTWDPSSRIGLNAGGGRLSPLREALLSSLTLSETLLQLNWLSSVSSRFTPAQSPARLWRKETVRSPSVPVWSPESPGSGKSSAGEFPARGGYP